MSDMGLDVRGRIYISAQGMNVQAGGKVADATAYAEWVKQQPGFQVGGQGPPGVPTHSLARRVLGQLHVAGRTDGALHPAAQLPASLQIVLAAPGRK